MSSHEVKLTGEYLVQPRVVESLVNSMRIPRIDEAPRMKPVTLTLYGVQFEELMPDREDVTFTCIVPPEGTRLGDKMDLSVLEGFVFYSPKGEKRGSADMFAITREQAQDIKARTRIAIASNPQLQALT